MLLVVYSNSVCHEAVCSHSLGIHITANTASTWQASAGSARVFLRTYPSRNVSLVSGFQSLSKPGGSSDCAGLVA
jgi:hypothetical protein